MLRLHYQILNLINFFSPIYIAFVFFLIKKIETVSDIFIVVSFITIFTQGFSANMRNIYLGSRIFLEFKIVVLMRILIGIFAFLLTVYISNFYFLNINNYFRVIDSIAFLAVINWIFELVIAKLEKEKTFNIYYCLNAFFLFVSVPFAVYFKNSFYLPLLIITYTIINIYIFRFLFFEILIEINQFKKKIFKKIFFHIGIISTLLKTCVNFSWKFFIVLFVGKEQATFLFIGFTVGSFYGTLFDISYGAKFLKELKNKKLFMNILFILYVFLILIFLFVLKEFFNYSIIEINRLVFPICFSLIGAFIMINALMLRQYYYELTSFRLSCYRADIFIQCLNFLIVPFLYYLDHRFIASAYLFSSIFYFLIFSSFSEKNGH
tara:strand:- start:22 stop:1155 length:1134 start_codon:yes stop_codon:yes gene_type:complete